MHPALNLSFPLRAVTPRVDPRQASSRRGTIHPRTSPARVGSARMCRPTWLRLRRRRRRRDLWWHRQGRRERVGRMGMRRGVPQARRFSMIRLPIMLKLERRTGVSKNASRFDAVEAVRRLSNKFPIPSTGFHIFVRNIHRRST